MKINYFVAPRTFDFTDEETRKAVITAIYQLAAELGVPLTEDSQADTVMCNGEVIANGTWIGCGCYYPRWLVITNQPEKVIQAAIKAGNVGKKRIKTAYQNFSLKFPPSFDKWSFKFHKGNIPENWVLKI